MLVTSIFPFPERFSKGLFFKGIKSCNCVVKAYWVNSLPNKEIVDQFELKAFTEATEIRKFGSEKENIGKQEKAGIQHFLLFP